ncbi:MAG: L-2-amino-thiazoline-4-carboxylic acid hydrolase [Myxococcales bacterium]
MDLVELVFKPWTFRVARRVLRGRPHARDSSPSGRFLRSEVDDIVARAWQRYHERSPDLSPQPTVGSRMNVRLAAFTLSFFEELLAAGIERGYAIELIADAAWGIYETWGRIAAALSSGSALGFATRRTSDGVVSLRFPFNAPGYEIRAVSSEEGTTAFDVVHCPIADFFRQQGAADLCAASWCNLDYGLAQLTHQKLERTRTLAEGADRCDFRILSGGELSGPRG